MFLNSLPSPVLPSISLLRVLKTTEDGAGEEMKDTKPSHCSSLVATPLLRELPASSLVTLAVLWQVPSGASLDSSAYLCFVNSKCKHELCGNAVYMNPKSSRLVVTLAFHSRNNQAALRSLFKLRCRTS